MPVDIFGRKYNNVILTLVYQIIYDTLKTYVNRIVTVENFLSKKINSTNHLVMWICWLVSYMF